MRTPAETWPIYGRHLLRYRDPGLTVEAADVPGGFAVLTGLPDVELNVSALYPPAGRADAAALLDRIDRAAPSALVFVSQAADPAIGPLLADRGFIAMPVPEPLMWRAGGRAAAPAASPFAVRRVRDEADLGGLVRVLEAAITLPPEITRRQFALERLSGDSLGTWLAWDGDEPMSAATLSWDDEACAVWEMMTVPSHRRRGAGRAVLSAALHAVLRPPMGGAVLTSTILGRPLYETLGFVAVDEATTWTRGATAEDLARVGQVLTSPS
jgi:GNAT superfamily N-acetyltransferase